jgi:hypothetical protein
VVPTEESFRARDKAVFKGQGEEGPTIDRRRLLGLLGVVPAVLSSACSRQPDELHESAERGADMRTRVSRWVSEYDSQGVHRTGTAGDQECARWLGEVLEEVGVDAALDPLPFGRIDSINCHVRVGRETVEAVPVFDGPFTEPEGVTGRLAAASDEAAEIGLVEIPPTGAGGRDFLAYRRGTAQRGIVAVTGGPRWELPPGLALVNAERYRAPYGPPCVQVGSESLEMLASAAEKGESVTVVHHAERVETEVYNNVATIQGRDRTLAPLVVMTPRSGWWRCASERGGGIAVLIEMAAALANARPLRTVHLVASTGHELGHYGLDHYMRGRSDLLASASCWIHLGANFAAAIGPRVLLQTSDEELRESTLGALARRGLVPDAETPQGERPLGEARNVFDGGGNFVSILGGNGLFHHPADRWPEAVDVERLASFAEAFAELALEMAAA